MSDLVVYYSFTGNNAVLARELKQRLSCESVRITEEGRRNRFHILLDLAFRRKQHLADPECDLRQYRRLVFVAPIWAGKIATPLAAFMGMERSNIGEYAFMSFCTGTPGQAAGIRGQLRELTGKEPRAVASLRANDLLPPKMRNTLRYATRYRVCNHDFVILGHEIDAFVRAL